MKLTAVITIIPCLLFPRVAAAQPSELYKCVSWGDTGQPDCGLESVTVIDYCESFVTYEGRVAWFPLIYRGPITIELNARDSYFTRFPLYLEIVPLASPPPPSFCVDSHPGFVIALSHGGYVCGGPWQRFGPTPLDDIVPLGGLYAIQLVFFESRDYAESPAIDCIRVTSSPTAVEPTTWGQVKILFR